MPPRKSDASKAAAAAAATATADEGTPAKDQQPIRDGINVEDLNLPKSIVTRLAKGVLPPNTQIQGNAMLAMTKSATVFVNYLASHANEHAHQSNRKTIAPQDVFDALEDLEFPDFRNRLEAELAKFNEVQTDKRNAYRSKVANKASGSGDVDPDANEDAGEEDSEMLEREGDADGQPVAKKARLDADAETETGERERERKEEVDNDQTEDEEGNEVQDEEEDEEEREEEQLENLEVEERVEEREDEALDNGEDSD